MTAWVKQTDAGARRERPRRTKRRTTVEVIWQRIGWMEERKEMRHWMDEGEGGMKRETERDVIAAEDGHPYALSECIKPISVEENGEEALDGYGDWFLSLGQMTPHGPIKAIRRLAPCPYSVGRPGGPRRPPTVCPLPCRRRTTRRSMRPSAAHPFLPDTWRIRGPTVYKQNRGME